MGHTVRLNKLYSDINNNWKISTKEIKIIYDIDDSLCIIINIMVILDIKIIFEKMIILISKRFNRYVRINSHCINI